MVGDGPPGILIGPSSAVSARMSWQWMPTRAVSATLNYIQMGDAPMTCPPIPGVGSVTGQFSERGTIFLEVGMSFSTGPASQ